MGGPLEGKTLEVIVAMAVWVVVLAASLYVIEARLRKRKKEDSDLLFEMARRSRCSEYDIFISAAKEWAIPEDRIDEDFKAYLLEGVMPFYVRAFVRSRGERERA
ncbi:MAG: hypothetical protein P8Y85_02775 [Nitrospirota bacterium]|jgi:hypothetical protein